MNIVIINAGNPFHGSGIVGLDLFNEFKSHGHTVRLLVNAYDPDYPPEVISIEHITSHWNKKLKYKFRGLFNIKNSLLIDGKYRFHGLTEKKIYYKTDYVLSKAGMRPDVILVLFAKDFINAKNIHELNTRTNAPIYWLMYDMAPFTGGCHYAWSCTGYQKKCGSCPALYSHDQFDISYVNLEFKRHFFDKTDIHIVAASEWQYRQVKSSSLFKSHPIHKILTAIDKEIFKPNQRETARKEFKIPSDYKVIFFGASGLSDERKGMKTLMNAFCQLYELISKHKGFNKEIYLLIAGTRFDNLEDSIPFKYYHCGTLNNTDGIASAYQAADLFVCPSLEDSGPTMINQSLMCGTPVVSFEMGVAVDLVMNGKTGYRVKLNDSEALALAMFEILKLSEPDYSEMKQNCRNLALELYQPEVNYQNWINILPDHK